MSTTNLYRHFDRDGVLLYVGISLSAVSRLSSHMKYSRWRRRIAHVTVESYPTREMALEAERRAILDECPAYNIIHNSGAGRDPEPSYRWTGAQPAYRPSIEDGDEWLTHRQVRTMLNARTFDSGALPPSAQLLIRLPDGRPRGSIYYWRLSDVGAFIQRAAADKCRESRLAEARQKYERRGVTPLAAPLGMGSLDRQLFTESEWARIQGLAA